MAKLPPLPESLDNFSYRLCIGRSASPSAALPEYYVPLIPLDILPPWLSVSGFPRRIYLSDENVSRWFTVANVPFPDPFVPAVPAFNGWVIEHPSAVSAQTKIEVPRPSVHAAAVEEEREHESDDDDRSEESPGGVLLAPFALMAPGAESLKHPADTARGSEPTPDVLKQDTPSPTTTQPYRLSIDTANTTMNDASDASSTTSGYATAEACLGESCVTTLTAGTLLEGTLAAPSPAPPAIRGEEGKEKVREAGDKIEVEDKSRTAKDSDRETTEMGIETDGSVAASAQKRSGLWSSMHRCDTETSPLTTAGSSDGSNNDSEANAVATKSQPKAGEPAATAAPNPQLLTQQHPLLSIYPPSQVQIRPQTQAQAQTHAQTQPEINTESRSRRRSRRGGRNRRSGTSSDPTRPSVLLPAPRFHSSSGPSSSSSSAAASASAPAKKKLEFCRQWCHTGDCAYAGDCVYMHAMPHTLDGLRSVGLSERPAWHCLTYALMEGRKRPRTLASPPQKQATVLGVAQRARQPSRRRDSAATRSSTNSSNNNNNGGSGGGGGGAQSGQSVLARTLETFDFNLTKHVRERDAARKKAERLREAALLKDGRAGGVSGAAVVAAATYAYGRGGSQSTSGAGDVGNLIDL